MRDINNESSVGRDKINNINLREISDILITLALKIISRGHDKGFSWTCCRSKKNLEIFQNVEAFRKGNVVVSVAVMFTGLAPST